MGMLEKTETGFVIKGGFSARSKTDLKQLHDKFSPYSKAIPTGEIK